MKEQIWNKVEEAVAHAIATLAVELIQTGVVIAVRKLHAMRDETKEGGDHELFTIPA